MNIKISLVLLMSLTFTSVKVIDAQELKSDTIIYATIDSLSTSNYRVHSITLTGSWYHPELDFFNEVFLPYCQVTDRFAWNYSLGGNITFSLPKEFRTRLGVSIWQDKVRGNETSNLESLKITLTRYRLGLLYAPEKLSVGKIQPYIGADGYFFLVKNKLIKDNSNPIQKGSDYSVAPLLGIEYVNNHFISSIEGAYNFGKYFQDICNCMGLARQNVLIDGPEISLSIGYKF